MAITNAQQARQLYKKGKRVGLFKGAQADASAGKGSMSPGTSTSGGSRNNSSSNDDNRQNYNVDKKTVKGGGKGIGTDKRGNVVYENATITKDDYDRGQSNFREQFNDYSGGARMLDSAYSTLSQRNNQKYQNRIYDARRTNIISQLQAAGLLTDDDEDMTVEQLRDKFQNSTDIVGADYGDRTMKSFDEISTIQDMVDKGFYKKDGVFDSKGPNYDPNRIPKPFNEVDLPGTAGVVANFLGKKMAGPLTSEYLGKQFDELEEIGSIPFNSKDDNSIKGLMERYEPNRYEREYGDNTGGGGDQQQTDPCLGPNPPAYCKVNNDDEEDATSKRNLGGLAPRFAGSIFDFTGLADGGRAGAMDGGRMMNDDDPTGGIMDLESGRQMYFLGKLVKKASRAVKKIVKSPIGKAALMYFGGNALMGAGAGGGSGIFSGLKGKLFGQLASQAAGPMKYLQGTPFTKGLFGKLGLTTGGGSMMPTLKGGLSLGLGIPFALDALGVGKEEEDTSAYDKYRKEMGLDINKYRYGNYLAPNFTGYGKADGGRIGYAEGSEEPVAKETMPLIDMDGKEMDLREDGGFVPLGRMERADDVPARLSKNEFVFTADAVRNAGEGDIDKGAEVMYNMMKNLESGGDVSEESQGLEGAREMFQTSQRLEEVI